MYVTHDNEKSLSLTDLVHLQSCFQGSFSLCLSSIYCYRAILGVKHLSSVAKPLCFNLKSSLGSAPYPSNFSDASLLNLNNCSCHSVPLGYVLLEMEIVLTMNPLECGLSQIGIRVFENGCKRINQ